MHAVWTESVSSLAHNGLHDVNLSHAGEELLIERPSCLLHVIDPGCVNPFTPAGGSLCLSTRKPVSPGEGPSPPPFTTSRRLLFSEHGNRSPLLAPSTLCVRPHETF